MKTPEEIKRVLSECDEGYACKRIECPYDDGKNLCNGSMCMADLRKESLAYICQLEAQTPRWISVEERLPEDGDSVLVIVNGRYGNIKFVNAICMATYSGDEGWIIDNYEEWYGAEVDYWMPLPEPPEEE